MCNSHGPQQTRRRQRRLFSGEQKRCCATQRDPTGIVGWGAAERCGNQGGDTYYKSGCCTTPCAMHDNWVPLTTAFDKADGTEQSELVPIVPKKSRVSTTAHTTAVASLGGVWSKHKVSKSHDPESVTRGEVNKHKSSSSMRTVATNSSAATRIESPTRNSLLMVSMALAGRSAGCDCGGQSLLGPRACKAAWRAPLGWLKPPPAPRCAPGSGWATKHNCAPEPLSEVSMRCAQFRSS